MKLDQLSKLINRLPKESLILGRYKYFNSAVLIPLVLVDDEYHFVFEKRAATITQGGEISFPGGKFDSELDPGFEATAIRETVEELGIMPERIQVQGYLGTLVAAMGAMVDAYVATIDFSDVTSLKVNSMEVEKVFTLPVSFFEANQPRKYTVRLEVQPWYLDQEGNKKVLFPADELKLPQKYLKPWGHRNHPIFFYETQEGPVWGITAELIYELIQKLQR